MAEGPRRPDAGAQLEELNDQLARFLQHADQLLEDWARFGSQVRATVDQEVARIEQAAAEAGERATRQLAGQVDKVATARVEKAIGKGLERIEAELARAGRATAVPPPAAPPIDRRLVGGVIAANALLVILLLTTWLRGPVRVAAPTSTIDAGVVAPTVPQAVLDACARLAAAWNDADAVTVWSVGADACGADAAVVAARLRDRLAPPITVDAGPTDAGVPVDGKPSRRGSTR